MTIVSTLLWIVACYLWYRAGRAKGYNEGAMWAMDEIATKMGIENWRDR